MVANRTSLFVKIPNNLSPSSTTGMPEISLTFINSRASANVADGSIVSGSITIPVSNFFTFETFCDCSSMDIFLCNIPIPPDCAIAIANLYSVTVSIAEDIRGTPNEILEVIFVKVLTSEGSTEDRAGLIRTSSNERDFLILECSISEK